MPVSIETVVRLIQAGYTAIQIAQEFGITPEYVRSVYQEGRRRWREEEGVQPTNLEERFNMEALGRRGNPGGGSSKRRKVIPNINSTGIGHFKGSFAKNRGSTRESSLTRHGCIVEQEMYGTISSPDIQYFGVQNVTPHMISGALATALVRMIFWRHFRVSYASLDDYLYPTPVATGNSELLRLDWITRRKLVDGTWSKTYHNGFSVIGQNTRVQDVTGNLEAYLLANSEFGFRQLNDSYRFCGYRLVYRDGSVSPDYDIESQYLRLTVMTVIQLQNVTPADHEATTVRLTRDAIDANPLVGACFTMRGLYPDIEGINDIDTVSFVKELQSSNGIPYTHGLIIPDAVPTLEFRSIPNPQIFREILKYERGLRLEPGEIKTDVLRFNFSGTLNKLISGLAYIHATAAAPFSGFRNGRFGLCKLYAFEKVVPTGSDLVGMNYHLDRYVNCVFREDYQTQSIRREHAKYKLDRNVVPALAATVVALKPVDVSGIDLDPINDEDVVDDVDGV